MLRPCKPASMKISFPVTGRISSIVEACRSFGLWGPVKAWLKPFFRTESFASASIPMAGNRKRKARISLSVLVPNHNHYSASTSRQLRVTHQGKRAIRNNQGIKKCEKDQQDPEAQKHPRKRHQTNKDTTEPNPKAESRSFSTKTLTETRDLRGTRGPAQDPSPIVGCKNVWRLKLAKADRFFS